jgi:hypothetical protein
VLAYLLTHSAAQRNTVEPFWCGLQIAPVSNGVRRFL